MDLLIDKMSSLFDIKEAAESLIYHLDKSEEKLSPAAKSSLEDLRSRMNNHKNKYE